jgi:putative flippase GtrA
MGETDKNNKKEGKREIGQIIRFAIVGVSNFLVDFVIYNSLLRFAPDVSAVWAGIISGTAAMINSFIFNKNFTFKAKKLSVFKLILFFVITAFGLYVIRPLIIYFFTSVWLWPSQVVYDITQWLRLPLSQEFDTRNLALLIAIIVVLFYNYLSYKFFVFNDEKK